MISIKEILENKKGYFKIDNCQYDAKKNTPADTAMNGKIK